MALLDTEIGDDGSLSNCLFDSSDVFNIEKEVTMYKKLLPMILLVSFSGLLFGCAATLTLEEYKPKSSEEEGIKMTLVALESAWNKHDQQGVLSLFHENAQLMTERQKSIVSKKEFAASLPKRMIDFSPTKLYEPTISVVGHNASVKLLVDMGQYQNELTLQMVRENNKWFIMGWEY
jgi:hypothetical protein